MSIFIIGGTGFIGRRLIPLLAQRGEEIVCMDINPQTANYGDFGKQVRVVRGDVTQFDDVVAQMAAAKPSRVINLAYLLGSEHPPRFEYRLAAKGPRVGRSRSDADALGRPPPLRQTAGDCAPAQRPLACLGAYRREGRLRRCSR